MKSNPDIWSTNGMVSWEWAAWACYARTYFQKWLSLFLWNDNREDSECGQTWVLQKTRSPRLILKQLQICIKSASNLISLFIAWDETARRTKRTQLLFLNIKKVAKALRLASNLQDWQRPSCGRSWTTPGRCWAGARGIWWIWWTSWAADEPNPGWLEYRCAPGLY